MARSTFLFIATFFVLLSVFSSGLEFAPSTELAICLLFIFLIGIPHGAIDNILFLRKNRISERRFYLIYVGSVALNIVFWISLPLLAYATFILISAYHFGQSQFSSYAMKDGIVNKALFLTWGLSVISGLLYFNQSDIVELTLTTEFSYLSLLNSSLVITITFFASTALTLMALVRSWFKGMLSAHFLLLELLVLLLIQIAFLLFPLLIGFTLYFVILHSFKVLREEYQFLVINNTVRTVRNFVKLLLPFTLLSVAGIGLLLGLIELGFIEISYAYILLILISSITLPHVFVMERFYGQYEGRGTGLRPE